jgi:PAS domain S-box-containing protein
MKYPIRTRFALLLLLVVTGALGALIALQQSQRRQVDLFVRDRLTDADAVFRQIIELKEAAFQVHAADYSSWDEFVTYTRTRDPHWAEVYIHQNIARFGVDIAWVLDAQMKVIYATRSDRGPPTRALPVFEGLLRRKLAESPFRHFFELTSQGVIEVWTAPIQPAADETRSTRPAGYYVIGRFWRPADLADLARSTNGEVSLGAPLAGTGGARPSSAGTMLEVRQNLLGLNGKPQALLEFRVRFPVAKQVEDIERLTLALIAFASLIILLVTHGFLSRWVLKPLQAIEATLEADDPALLGSMSRRQDQLGKLARLIREFFQQRDALVHEAQERVHAELQVTQQKDLLRRVIDTDPNLIYVVDGAGRFVMANVCVADTLGVEVNSLVGCQAVDILAPLGLSESFQRTCAQALESGEVQEADETLTTLDGHVRQFRSIRSPLGHGSDAVQVLTLSTDMTEQLRHDQEILEARDAAEAGARAKARFLANVSHELRTPMHGILSYARFGLREWGTAERKDLLDYFQNIHESAESLLMLLNDILDLSRIESGREIQFQFESIDLEEVVDQAVGEFESLLEEHGIRLAVKVVGPLPPVRADRGRIVQVLRNLISNAAKFTPPGTSIEISSEWDARCVRLGVCDEGIGIPEDELEAVFGEFIQSSRANASTGGTGLGLALCSQIVEAHGGRIWAENRPSGGTSLLVELPRDDAAERPDSDEEHAPEPPPETQAAA